MGRNWYVRKLEFASANSVPFPTRLAMARRQVAEERKLTMTQVREIPETITIPSLSDSASAEVGASKRSTPQSEVRTVRSITSELPEDLRPKAKVVFDAVQSNWKVYVSKDNALRQTRSDLAGALVEARKLLEEAGKKRLFHRFLEAKGIPRSTAYDLIKDFERAAGAPEVLKIVAEQEGVDLTAQRHAVQLQQVIDSNDMLSKEQALDVVSSWKKKKPAGTAIDSGASDLSEYEKQVCAVFTALKKTVGRISEETRLAVVMEALQYYFHYCTGREEPISIEPAAAEDDWVLQSEVARKSAAVAA